MEKKTRFAEIDENDESSKKKVLISEETTAPKNKILMTTEEKKKESESGQKPKKKLMFADEFSEKPKKKIGFKENEDENSKEEIEQSADRSRSRTNFQKKSMQDSMDLSSLHPRSKSCDTGKREIESQNREIDEMFELLANFQTFRLNKKYFYTLILTII